MMKRLRWRLEAENAIAMYFTGICIYLAEYVMEVMWFRLIDGVLATKYTIPLEYRIMHEITCIYHNGQIRIFPYAKSIENVFTRFLCPKLFMSIKYCYEKAAFCLPPRNVIEICETASLSAWLFDYLAPKYVTFCWNIPATCGRGRKRLHISAAERIRNVIWKETLWGHFPPIFHRGISWFVCHVYIWGFGKITKIEIMRYTEY